MRLSRALRGGRFGKNSITDLSGNVFAFAMTLLVLNLAIPSVSKTSSAVVLANALLGLWPAFLAYVMSFAFISSYWVAHRSMLVFVVRADRTFLWMNLFYLMCVVFLPFPTRLMATYPRQWVAMVTYGGTAIVTLLTLYAQWQYAARRGRLVDPDLDASVVHYATRKILGSILICLFCVGLSFFRPLISLFIFALMPIVTMWPDRY
jgi:uncharacterized membrane protein